jgi:hypothetical protein
VDQRDCPTSYIALSNQVSRYRLRTDALTVFAHHTLCVAEGAHLAVIDTPQEAAALRQLVDDAQGLPPSPFGPLVFTGGAQRSNQFSPGAGWLSVTGGFNASFWNIGEPNDGDTFEFGDEQFAAIWRDHNLFADVPNTGPFAAICECDGKEITSEYKEIIELSGP